VRFFFKKPDKSWWHWIERAINEITQRNNAGKERKKKKPAILPVS